MATDNGLQVYNKAHLVLVLERQVLVTYTPFSFLPHTLLMYLSHVLTTVQE